MITREKKIGLGITIFFESTDKNVYLPDNKQKKKTQADKLIPVVFLTTPRKS